MGSHPNPPRRARWHLVPFLCVALSMLSPPLPATGQGGHPLPRQIRPLHERLALADAVAAATIGEVETGRIQLADISSWLGDVPPDARLKRSPSKPLELEAGERVLLLMQGARSPYLSVDTARELVRLGDPAEESRWGDAIQALAAADDEPAALADAYTDWLDSESESLRKLAVAALSDVGAPYQPLPGEFFAARGAAAWDPSLSLGIRRTSAQLASLRAEGASVLATHARRCDPGMDAEILIYSVVSAVRYRVAERDPALLCALSQNEPEIVTSTLRTVGRTGDTLGEAAMARITELSTRGDEAVRIEAERALERLR